MDFDIYKLIDKYRLTRTEQEILQYVLDHSEEALDLNVRQIAKINYTSPATVIKLAQKLGYKGYIDMVYRINFGICSNTKKVPLQKKYSSALNMDCLLAHITADEIYSFVRLMNESRGTVYTYGMGFSQPIAQYIARKLLILGYASIFTDSFELYDHNQLGAKMAFLVSRTGETYEIIKAAKMAMTSGIFVVSFTGEQSNSVAQNSFLNFKIQDNDKFDDRNVNANFFYPNVMTLFEYMISRFLGSDEEVN